MEMAGIIANNCWRGMLQLMDEVGPKRYRKESPTSKHLSRFFLFPMESWLPAILILLSCSRQAAALVYISECHLIGVVAHLDALRERGTR